MTTYLQLDKMQFGVISKTFPKGLSDPGDDLEIIKI